MNLRAIGWKAAGAVLAIGAIRYLRTWQQAEAAELQRANAQDKERRKQENEAVWADNDAWTERIEAAVPLGSAAIDAVGIYRFGDCSPEVWPRFQAAKRAYNKAVGIT